MHVELYQTDLKLINLRLIAVNNFFKKSLINWADRNKSDEI